MSDHTENAKVIGLVAALRQIEASWSEPVAPPVNHSQHLWFHPGCDECRRERDQPLVKRLAPEPINPGIL